MKDYEKGVAIALRYIANRMKTEAEVRGKLKTKCCDGVIEEIITDFKEKGYINDENYITFYIKDRVNLNPMGRLRIKRELEQRGIEKALIETNEEYNAIDEKSLLDDLLYTKLSNYDLNNNNDLRKVLGYLSRRGFEYGYINTALNKHRKIRK